MVHLLIKFYNDWVIFISHTKLSSVFTLCTNTDFIRMLFHQLDRAVHHNLKWKGAEKMPSVAKKRPKITKNFEEKKFAKSFSNMQERCNIFFDF